ncbi:MAG TPA: hypothetical protein PKU92_08755, partial [Agitococcus sp.]|nr:hypothetical protein [Agitococcus sp.]
GNNYFLTRLLAYKQIKDIPPALGGGVYLGLLAETGAVSMEDKWSSRLFESTPYSVGVVLAADTRLGPFYLTIAKGDQDRHTANLTLGVTY